MPGPCICWCTCSSRKFCTRSPLVSLSHWPCGVMWPSGESMAATSYSHDRPIGLCLPTSNLPTNPCLTGASIVNNTAAMWLLLLLPFLCSKLFPSLIHRHPNGSCANFLLAHSREAIIFPFIISPILCLPTYFVFKVRETLEISTREHEAMYHVYFDTNSMLFR